MKKTCFVICPIGESGSETRKHSDQVLKYIVTPSLPDTFEAIRADKIEQSGVITQQIMEKIEESELVLADLTGPNANVLYELSFRHALRLPFIQIKEKNSKIPFDVSANRTIDFDLSDLDSVGTCVESIKKQVQEIESGHIEIDNPISISQTIRSLRKSAQTSENVSLEKILEEIIEIKSYALSGWRSIDPREILPPEYVISIFSRFVEQADRKTILHSDQKSHILLILDRIKMITRELAI